MVATLMKSALGQLRIVGFVEGVSFLVLLFLAMPLKYIWGMPEAVRMVGMAHGVLFVLYIAYVVIVVYQQKWSFLTLVWLVLASFVPFGTFVSDAKILAKER
jgi:integral membrane protein